MSVKRLVGQALAGVLLVTGFAACGSDDQSTEANGSGAPATVATPTASGSGDAAQRADAAAKSAVAKAGGAVDLPKGKKIGFLMLVGVAESSQRMKHAAERAAKDFGWDLVAFDAGGNPAKAAANIKAALNQGVDAIVSTAITPALMTQGLQDAKRKGVPVINISNAVDASPLLNASYVQEYQKGIELLAEEMRKRVGGGSEVGLFETPLLRGYVPAVKAFKGAADSNGWKVVQDTKLGLEDVIGDARRATSSLLSAHPAAKGLFVDIANAYSVAAQVLKQRGKCGKVELYGDHDDLLNQKSVRDGCGTALAAYPVEAVSYQAMDQLAEHFARNRSVDQFPKTNADLTAAYGLNLLTPRVLTKATLPGNGAYSTPTQDFVTFFAAKWKQEFGVAAAAR
jgi:ABC-type sugar transport system substrate-binding protein